jgi:hypothetical protein
MSGFEDLINTHRERITTHDGRLKQLQLEEGVQRDTLADDRKSDVWPSARERLDSIQSEIPREQAALHQELQDLENVHAVRDAVDRAVGGLQSDARPATLKEAREIADRVHSDGQAAESARSKMLGQQHEWQQEGAEYLQDELEGYIARPEVQAVLRSSGREGHELRTEVGMPDDLHKQLYAGHMDSPLGGFEAMVDLALAHRTLQQRQSERQERALLTQGDALAAYQSGDLDVMERAINKDWEKAPEELGAYGLTPIAPGDYYKNLFDHQVQRLHQDLRLDQQQWAQLGLQTEDVGNRAKAVWIESKLSHTVCHQYATREVGVDAVERPLVEYERVLHERGVEDIAERFAAHRLTLEKAAEPAIALRAQELHALYFTELEGAPAPPSRELTEHADRDVDPGSSGPDLVSRDSPELDR